MRNKVNNPSGATDIAANFSTYQLVNGGVVSLAFVHAVPAGATLNINNMGAKPIYYHDAPLTAGVIKADDRCLFMYNGPAERYYLIAIDRWGVDLDALATVAHTGSYNDLIDKPNLFSGNYNDLTNKPTIPTVPTNVSAFVNDAGYLTSIPDSLGGIGEETDPIFTAWDKSYNDLTNKPTNADFGQGIVRNKVNNLSGETDITVNFSTYQLVNGGVVALAFTRAVPEGATLNINNKGAKPIYYHEAPLTAGLIKANDRCLFMYNGPAERYYLIAIDRWGADIDALATVAHTGDYNDLTNKPTIPTQLSQLNNNVGYITASDIPAQQNADWNATSGAAQILHKPNLAPVATSGNYNDLTNQPTNADFGQGIVRNKVNNLSGETDITVNFSTYELVNGGVVSLVFTRAVPAGATLNINNKGAKPIYYHEAALPAGLIKANDRCLFMYNGPGERYYLLAIDRWGADLNNIPTTTSQLTNDAGFITSSQVSAAQVNADWNATSGAAKILNKPNLSAVATSGDYNDLNNTPTIPTVPTNVSAFVNDAGYLTAIPDGMGGISVEADPIFSAWDKDYNDLINKPTNATFGQGIVRAKIDNPADETNIEVTFANYELVTGGVVSLAFTRDVPAHATLNINNKGAKTIYYHGAVLAANVIKAGDRCLFMYNSNAGRYYLIANDRWGTEFDNLATVAHTGDYSDLTGTPTIPTQLSELTNDMDYISHSEVPAQVQADWNQTDENNPAFIHNKPDMSNYLTTSDFDNFVTKTENETVGGQKTFTDVTTFDGEATFNDNTYFNDNATFNNPTEFKKNVTVNETTGRILVPSVLSSVGDDGSLTVTDNLSTNNCHNAVNFCDLETVYQNMVNKFNNLNNQIDDLLDSINKLNNKLNTPKDGEPCPNTPTVTDRDGNSYSTVRIGNQCWMRENLRVTHWPDGTAISSASHLSSRGTAAGYFYTFNDVMANTSASATSNPTQGICPVGWRVPSDADFNELVTYSNTKANARRALMAAYGWSSNPVEGQNALGMSLIANTSHYSELYSSNKSEWDMFENPSNDLHIYGTAGNASGQYGVRCIRANSNGEEMTIKLPTVETNEPTTANIYDVNVTSGTVSLKIKPGTITSNDSVPPLSNISRYGFIYSSTLSTASTLVRGASGATDKGTNLTAANQPASYPFTMTSYSLSDLSSGQVYYYRAYAVRGADVVYGAVKQFTAQQDPKSCKAVLGNSYPEHVEYDGMTYPTVGIGSQCWLAQNLQTTTNISSSDRYYVGDISGYLYNWNAALKGTDVTTLPVRGICPEGWHVATTAEYNTLKSYMQGQSAYVCSGGIANALAYTSGWTSSSTTCTPGYDQSSNNASGFSAYPGGYYNSGHNNYHSTAYIWTTNGYFYLSNSSTNVGNATSIQKYWRMPVRCVYGSAAPTVSTSTTAPTVSYNSASSVGGSVHNNGGLSVSAKGIVYSSSNSTPTVGGSGCSTKTSSASSTNFTVTLSSLNPGTLYYYRAYATNSKGTTYGEVKSFTTQEASYVTNWYSDNSGAITEISKTSAIIWGKCYPASGDPIQYKGFILYKKNSSGTFDQVFDEYYSSPGTHTITGGYTVTLGNSSTTENGFYMIVDGLEPGATYKYMAEVKGQNSGWWYPGKVQSSTSGIKSQEFTTYKAPAVTTQTAVTDFTGSSMSATLKGKLTDAGIPANETKQGILIAGSSSNLDIAHYTTTGTFNRNEATCNSNGEFSRGVTLWDANTTYYYRAYAYNTTSGDTVYGTIKSFTTPAKVSDVYMGDNYANAYYYSTEVRKDSVRVYVGATAPSNAPVYRYGIVYSTSNTTPTVGGTNCSVQWSTSQAFWVENLAYNTKYYMRAVAYNSANWNGSQTYTYAPVSNIRIIRTKLVCGSILTDQDGNTYQTGMVGSRCWMKNNLKAKHYDNTLNYSTSGSGPIITNIGSTSSSAYSSTTKYAYYPNGSVNNVGGTSYSSGLGLLYNYPATSGQDISGLRTGQGICPRGWHIPTYEDITNAKNNFSSFAPQYAGSAQNGSNYPDFGTKGCYYSTGTFTSEGDTYHRILQVEASSPSSATTNTGFSAWRGASVRCVQD